LPSDLPTNLEVASDIFSQFSDVATPLKAAYMQTSSGYNGPSALNEHSLLAQLQNVEAENELRNINDDASQLDMNLNNDDMSSLDQSLSNEDALSRDNYLKHDDTTLLDMNLNLNNNNTILRNLSTNDTKLIENFHDDESTSSSDDEDEFVTVVNIINGSPVLTVEYSQ
jgi:hypothetical protein